MSEPAKCSKCGASVRKIDGKCGACEYREHRRRWWNNLSPDKKKPCKCCGTGIYYLVEDNLCWVCRIELKERAEKHERDEKLRKRLETDWRILLSNIDEMKEDYG